MKNIYLFSGLGADYRAFQSIQLPGYNLIFMEWILPFRKENLAQYAQRISLQITDVNPILIGLSFGGMVALEIAKYKKPESLFLISSARNKRDLHAAFPGLVRSGILKIIPAFLFRNSNFFIEYLMGVEQKNKQILSEIIADTDTAFMYWALNAMSEWESDFLPEILIEIHGTADRLIPFRKTAGMHVIEKGGHLMILDRADEIQKIILDYLCLHPKNDNDA